jgi:hypothetical protein
VAERELVLAELVEAGAVLPVPGEAAQGWRTHWWWAQGEATLVQPVLAEVGRVAAAPVQAAPVAAVVFLVESVAAESAWA